MKVLYLFVVLFLIHLFQRVHSRGVIESSDLPATLNHHTRQSNLFFYAELVSSCNLLEAKGQEKVLRYSLHYPSGQHFSSTQGGLMIEKTVEEYPEICISETSKLVNITYSAQYLDNTIRQISTLDNVQGKWFTFVQPLEINLPNPLYGASAEKANASFTLLSENLHRDFPTVSDAYEEGSTNLFIIQLEQQSNRICTLALNHIDRRFCAEFNVMLKKNLLTQLKGQVVKLPSVQWAPYPDNVFLYLHIEKTGGTTLRDIIVSSAAKGGKSVFVPCYHGLSCLTFSLPSARELISPNHTAGAQLINHIIRKHFPSDRLSVMAGHFSWGVWKSLPYYHLNPEALPPMLIVNRHPVERVISYFYQRCYDKYQCNPRGKLLRDLTTQELTDIILHHRTWYVDEDLQRLTYSLQNKYSKCNETANCPEYDDAEHQLLTYCGDRREAEIVVIDEGMAEAACRAILNKKATTNMRFMARNGSQVLDLPPALSEDDIKEALNRINYAVVGLLESWNETITMINYFFPWIDFQSNFNFVKMPSKHKSFDTKETLPKSLVEVIESYNKCDIVLYHRMQEIFERQSRVVHNKQNY